MVRHLGQLQSSLAVDTQLPVLVPGVDRFPAACEHCGSTWLGQDPPLGQHRYGLLSCGTCGRELAWVDAPLRPARSVGMLPSPNKRPIRGGSGERSSALSSGMLPAPRTVRSSSTASATSSLVPTSGCGLACTAWGGHDPVSHERHGRQQLLDELAARRSGLVLTGPLLVDFDAQHVAVDGRRVALTPIEYGLMGYFASRLGEVCRHAEIVEAVWDRATAEAWSTSSGLRTAAWHALRSKLSPLRAKLGIARDLLENVPGRGYRLKWQPPTAPEEACVPM